MPPIVRRRRTTKPAANGHSRRGATPRLAWRLAVVGRIDEAVTLAMAACEAIDRLDDDAEAPVAGGRARQILARLLFATDRPDEGEREYFAARDLFAGAGDDERLARCDADLAIDLMGAGRLDDAEGRAEAAVAGFSMLERPVDAAPMQLVLGRIQAESERYEEARNNFAAAGAVFAGQELDAGVAEASYLEGLVTSELGDDDAAVDRFTTAIEAGHRAGVHDGEAASRVERGLAFGRLGRYDEAASDLQAAADAFTELGEGPGAARATYALANARGDVGDLPGAVAAFEAAAEGFAAGDFTAAAAQARLDGAAVLDQLGRVDEALSWLEQAVAGFAAAGEILAVALARRAWGGMAGATREAEGLAALADARAVFAEHGAGWDVAECDDMTARVLAGTGQVHEAIGPAMSAAEGFRAAGDRLALAAIDTLLGRLLADADLPEEAVERFQDAIAAAGEEQADPLAARAHEALADVLDSLGRADEAAASRQEAARLAD